MTPQFNLRTSRLLLTVVTFFVFEMAVAPGAVAQKLPTATERERETKSATVRRERRKKARQTAPAASRTSASVQSDQFLDLGDRFREQEKWKAAEAAYKEAINVWPGNVDALVELGFLYLDRNKLNEAQQTYSRLRPLHASYASDLLAEINRRKAALAH